MPEKPLETPFEHHDVCTLPADRDESASPARPTGSASGRGVESRRPAEVGEHSHPGPEAEDSATARMGFCRRLLDFWRVLRASFATPRRLAGDRSTHWTYVVLFALMLTVPFFLEVSPTGHVHVEMAGKRLPPLCLSKALFRVDCPGCGLTRSFALATHLRFIESLRMHRVGLLLYAFFAIQMVVRILALRRHPALETRWFRSANYHATVTMILLLLGNWILGFFCGGNGL